MLTAAGCIASAISRGRARRQPPGRASLDLPRMGEKSVLLRPPPAAARAQ